MMASVRSQLELLDAKIAELQQTVEPEDIDMTPIDLDILEGPLDSASPEAVPEPVDEIDDLPEDDCGDMPIFDEPEPVAEAEPEPEPLATVNDVLAEKQAWRTDMPGTAVKDIRSAISLNDRIIFINYLFNEDPMAFQEALTRINAMDTLDEAVAYVVSEHPEWNLESDFVYRFMMAVRRRIRQ